jgi:hypothetical protein
MGTSLATIPPATSPTGESDAAALRRLLAATAQPGPFGTGARMPNAAPPLHAAARRRAAAAPSVSPACSRTVRPLTATAAPAPQAGTALTGVPASCDGFGALLAGAGERSAAEALTLATVVSDGSGTGARTDLSGIWARPAAAAAARSSEVIRALDGKGRLMLPITAAEATGCPPSGTGRC